MTVTQLEFEIERPCIFCEHEHPHSTFCDAPVCGDGCCHCGCSDYLPLEAGPVRRFVQDLQAEIATQERKARQQTEALRKLKKRHDFAVRSYNSEIERRWAVQRRLDKAEKKLAKK